MNKSQAGCDAPCPTRFVAGIVSIDLGESFYVLNEDGSIKEFSSWRRAEEAAFQMFNEAAFVSLTFVNWE